jgi:hypothetical protein
MRPKIDVERAVRGLTIGQMSAAQDRRGGRLLQ